MNIGESSKGKTADSGSAYRGSNPLSPAIMVPSSSGLGRGPLKAKTRVRLPLGPPIFSYDVEITDYH